MIEIIITRKKNKNNNKSNLEEDIEYSPTNLVNKKEYLFNIYDTFLIFLQKNKILILLLITLFIFYTI